MQLDPTGCIDSYNGKGYFQIRHSWDSDGYRLYFGDKNTCSQVNGEINGKVFPDITSAVSYCWDRFKEVPFIETLTKSYFPNCAVQAKMHRLRQQARELMEQAETLEKLNIEMDTIPISQSVVQYLTLIKRK